MKIDAKRQQFDEQGAGHTDVIGDVICRDDLHVKAPTGGGLLKLVHLEVEHECNGGAATETITGAIPAGAKLKGLAGYNKTALAGTGLTTYSVGDGSDADRWGAGIAKTIDAGFDQGDATADPAGTWAATARDIVLTAAAGQFDSGTLHLDIWYFTCVKGSN